MGYESLWLGVWDMNKPAISFYKKFGFSEVGSHPWKFQHGNIDYEDIDLIMSLNLD
jgi:ribosomal protein S18 acetylase RimI-like enzyme